MNDSLIAIGSLIAYAVIIAILFWHGGYKSGQVDALNGKQKYKLIEFENGTRQWVKNPKPGDYDQEIKIIK